MTDWIEEITSAVKGHRAFFELLFTYMEPKTIVELGVDYGYTTSVFSNALKTNSLYKSKVYGIDWFQGDTSSGFRDTKEFVDNKIQEHNMNNVQIIKGDFNEIVKAWNRDIDILFIDGSHDYESVKSDFEKWSKFVYEDEGLILFHDIAVEEFGVKQFYDEIDGYYKLEFNHSAGLGVITKDSELFEHLQKIAVILKRIYR